MLFSRFCNLIPPFITVPKCTNCVSFQLFIYLFVPPSLFTQVYSSLSYARFCLLGHSVTLSPRFVAEMYPQSFLLKHEFVLIL
jgi:hypothetical protein